MKDEILQYFEGVININQVSANDVYVGIKRSIEDGRPDCIEEIYREFPRQIKQMRETDKLYYYGVPPLYYALKLRYNEQEETALSVVNMLVNLGENIHRRPANGETLLSLAMQQDYISVINLLLKLHEHAVNNSSMSENGVELMVESLYGLFSKGYYDSMNILLSDDIINILRREDETGVMVYNVTEWLGAKNYKIAMYFMEKGLINPSEPIEIHIDKYAYDEGKVKEFLQIFNISYIHNSVANLCSMLDCLAVIINNESHVPEFKESYPLLLDELTNYVPTLTSKLLVDLGSIKKEVRHKKLAETLKFFPKAHNKYIELKDQEIQDPNLRNNLGDKILDLKEKIEEGVTIVGDAYNPSYFYHFFMRNEGRDFSRDEQENIKIGKKPDIAWAINDILSFLDFKEAASFGQALGHKPSNFLDKEDIEARHKKLKIIDQDSQMHKPDEEIYISHADHNHSRTQMGSYDEVSLGTLEEM